MMHDDEFKIQADQKVAAEVEAYRRQDIVPTRAAEILLAQSKAAGSVAEGLTGDNRLRWELISDCETLRYMSDMSNEDLDPDDPMSAASYAIEATARIAVINATRLAPAMANLGVHHRRLPRAEASQESWDQYFKTLDALEGILLDGLHETSQLRLNVVAVTLPHVVDAFYRQPKSKTPSQRPWQVAGCWAEKAAVHDALDTLAMVGFHWGNGFVNPGSEI